MSAPKWLAEMTTNFPLSLQSATRLLTLGLVAILAWTTGRIVWSFIEPPPQIVAWQPKVVAVSQSASEFKVSDLLAMKLFGQYKAQPTIIAAKPVKQDAPQTKLNLSLVGVVASSRAESALAVITNQGKQNTYGVNEVIDGTRATLQAVYNDRVIIRNNGRDETVMLAGLRFSKPSQTTLAQVNPEVKNISAAKLAKIKKQILSEPQSIFNYIRLSQVQKNGQLMGYRVNPGKDRILFDYVGLKTNDLAVAINGNDLTDSAVMAKLWGELASATDFTLTVERDSQLHDIHIELQ